VEIVASPEAKAAQASASPARLTLETRYIESVASETFKPKLRGNYNQGFIDI